MNAAIMLIVVFRILPEDGALEKRFCLSPHAVNTTSYKETLRFPSGSAVKNLPANAGDSSLISGSRSSPGERNGNPLRYSCLGSPQPGGLQSMESKIHDLATKQQQWVT